jgi:hypothetical protein
MHFNLQFLLFFYYVANLEQQFCKLRVVNFVTQVVGNSRETCAGISTYDILVDGIGREQGEREISLAPAEQRGIF